MNLASPWNASFQFLFRMALKCRKLLPKRSSEAFGRGSTKVRPRIERICVINLTRQPGRWALIEQELRHVLDWSGSELWNLTERYAAVDAREFIQEPIRDAEVDPVYTLGDQLFVEPQPLALPSRLELDAPIQMSRPEIAIARSHINLWRQVAASDHEYVLILEDDVWFRFGFTSLLDQAWGEIQATDDRKCNFDILYLSYEEVKHGAPKNFLSTHVFRPVRGLWHLSGYVVSRQGAEKLLQRLPCRGPVDLWLNQQFEVLDVRATSRSIISQRRDMNSTNSYSILPVLTKVGVINSESASSFHARPSEGPVFAFGPGGSGLSSLAMALSMLGYTCCSDLAAIPRPEHEMLLTGRGDRVFNAYVNIQSLEREASAIRERYPRAKFFVTTTKATGHEQCVLELLDALNGTDVAFLDTGAPNKWHVVCEHLRCAPPTCSFPELADMGQRQLLNIEPDIAFNCKIPKRDKSPWIIEPRWWRGIRSSPTTSSATTTASAVSVSDCLESLDAQRWLPRDDTFTDNLALFRPSNIEFDSGHGASLSVKREHLGVREYSAAAFSSRDRYLFGRFEATIKASNVSGVVTGVFLHRNSPRQEIDIEIAGNRTDRLLVNVFFNPGGEGARFDYGYRGAPSLIDLGFDASQAYHRFAIEWEPSEIRWYVDDHLIHRRVDWEPTPIPHLPMAFHINAWPSRSKELAGRLDNRRLPATTCVKAIVIEAARQQGSTPNGHTVIQARP